MITGTPVSMEFKKKYPRTYHLPWSQTVSADDKRLPNTSHFAGEEVIVSVKMDGEHTDMYSDYMHARSLDSKHNYTRDWAKRLHSILKFEIPENWIFSFENMAYFHSIFYDDLEGFCYLLNIWKDDGYCLHFDEVNEYAQLLELPQPRILYRGIYDEKIISNLHNTEALDLTKDEGYVLRKVTPFHRDDFKMNVAKFVRSNHVQVKEDQEGEVEHWLKTTYPNKLSKTKPILPSYMG